MNKDKIKLIIRNMELLVDALKVELLQEKNENNQSSSYFEDDYDEVYTEEF
jgi:hypothetical protein